MLVNPVRGQVEIEIGGGAQVLHMTNGVAIAVQDMLGKNFFKLAGDLDPKTICAILFCGLKHANPKLTFAQVVAWSDDKPLTYWAQKIAVAINRWQGIPDDGVQVQEGADPLDQMPPRREDLTA